MSPRAGATTWEHLAEVSYAGRAAIAQGTRPLGEISSRQLRFSTVYAQPLSQQTTFLAGLGWQRLEFSPPAGSPVPDHLGSVALKLGCNHQFTPQWSGRLEIDPGLYSDFAGGTSGGDFNAPMALRLIYAASRDVQWAGGVNLDFRSGIPVFGGIGVRWQFAPDWTLLLLLPAPRVEYAIASGVTLFAGAALRGGTFRVAPDYGRKRGRPELDNQNVDYREITIGAGVRWQLKPGLALNAGAGRMLDRRFEFEKRNLLLNGDGAPSLQLTLTGAF